jgi:hypothetical protein
MRVADCLAGGRSYVDTNVVTVWSCARLEPKTNTWHKSPDRCLFFSGQREEVCLVPSWND